MKLLIVLCLFFSNLAQAKLATPATKKSDFFKITDGRSLKEYLVRKKSIDIETGENKLFSDNEMVVAHGH